MKHRVRIRLHHKMYDAIELEAVWQDSKVGTLTNRLLHEEFAKIRQVGLDRCVCCDGDAARTRTEPEKYYVLPSLDCREKYMPTHGRGLDTKGQLTLLLDDAELAVLDALFDRESDYLRGVWSESQGRRVKSYRYQIVGMLLHNPMLQELQMQ